MALTAGRQMEPAHGAVSAGPGSRPAFAGVSRHGKLSGLMSANSPQSAWSPILTAEAADRALRVVDDIAADLRKPSPSRARKPPSGTAAGRRSPAGTPAWPPFRLSRSRPARSGVRRHRDGAARAGDQAPPGKCRPRRASTAASRASLGRWSTCAALSRMTGRTRGRKWRRRSSSTSPCPHGEGPTASSRVSSALASTPWSACRSPAGGSAGGGGGPPQGDLGTRARRGDLARRARSHAGARAGALPGGELQSRGGSWRARVIAVLAQACAAGVDAREPGRRRRLAARPEAAGGVRILFS